MKKNLFVKAASKLATIYRRGGLDRIAKHLMEIWVTTYPAERE